MQKDPLSFESLCVGSPPDAKTTKPHQLPIYASSSFVFEHAQDGIDIFTGKKSGHVYSRYANPTIDSVAYKIAQLEAYDIEEEVFGLMTSSGMSAISTLLMGLCSSGDHILTQGNLYGGTTEFFAKLLGRMGMETHFRDLTDLDLIERTLAKHPEIKVIYLETPSNPTMSCVDLSAVANIAKAKNVITVIDNTFCTPYIQRPLSHGIDYVVHSTTKYLNGHGNSIAGIVIGKKDETYHKIWQVLKLTGTNCNPWDAWLTNNGLKTLPIRMDRHSSNAMQLANHLASKKKVNLVNYNGLPQHPYHETAKKQMHQFGGMLSFELQGGGSSAIHFMNALRLATQAPTLGDVDTLVLHPVSSSHLNVDETMREQSGITDGLVRMSVGIEKIEDLIDDVDQALSKI